jgi:hypothetical protein
VCFRREDDVFVVLPLLLLFLDDDHSFVVADVVVVYDDALLLPPHRQSVEKDAPLAVEPFSWPRIETVGPVVAGRYYYTPSHHREDEIEDVPSLLAVDIVVVVTIAVVVMIAVDVKAHDGSSPFLLHARLLFFLGFVVAIIWMDWFRSPFTMMMMTTTKDGWMDGGIKLQRLYGSVVVI